ARHATDAARAPRHEGAGAESDRPAARLSRLSPERRFRRHPRAGPSARANVRGEPAARNGGWRGHRRLRRRGAPTVGGILQAPRLVRWHRQHLLRTTVGARLHGAHDLARGPACAPALLVPGTDARATGFAADRCGLRGVAHPARRVVVSHAAAHYLITRTED